MTLQVYHYMADCSGNFTENLPTSQRPPVPGEENETTSSMLGGSTTIKERSPCATPRRSTLMKLRDCTMGDEDEAPLGFEPEGSASVTPPYTRWTESLHALLSDEDGICLFKQFLMQEKAQDPLLFWLATAGFKKKSCDDPKRNELAKVIYKKFIKADGQQAVKISSSLRTNIAGMVRSSAFDETLFDTAQAEIEEHIRESTYPMFLKSDLYVQYINNGGISPKSSSTSSSSGANSRPTGYLPTLPEDAELMDIPTGEEIPNDQGQVPLTMEMLMKTSFQRRTTTKTQEGCYLKANSTRVLSPYHPSFTSFAPAVSTNDSELQSLSSDAISDDTMSLTDSSIDGRPVGKHQKQQQRRRQSRAIKTNVRQNGRVSSFPPFPITQRPPKDVQPVEPAEFARILTEKLEKVLRQRETEERLTARLRKVEEEETDPNRAALTVGGPTDATRLSAVMFEKGALPVDDPNSILDDHFSRVFVDSARNTPGEFSPRSHSPERTHHGKVSTSMAPQIGVNPKMMLQPQQQQQQHSKLIIQRQRAKVSYTPGYNLEPEQSMSQYKHYMHQKFKHMELDTQKTSSGQESGDSIYHKLRARGDSINMDLITDTKRHVKMSKKSSKKSDISSISKTTDSGIYEGPPSLPSDNERKQHIEQWIEEGERYVKPSSSSKQNRRTNQRMSPDILQAMSTQQHRQSLPKKLAYNSSRPTSQEQTHCQTIVLPQRSSPHLPTQPIMQDPSMPLNKPPEPLTVLEEVRRRIDVSSKQRQRHSDISRKDRRPPSTNPPMRVTSAPVKMVSLGSGGPQDASDEQGRRASSKSRSYTPANSDSSSSTTVAYYFCNDPIPYRTTLPGDRITLAQFKSLISKKGDYRYTFKTLSDEFDTGVVHEIISDDSTILPIYQGKIIGRVEKID